jgi:hypothetical protein
MDFIEPIEFEIDGVKFRITGTFNTGRLYSNGKEIFVDDVMNVETRKINKVDTKRVREILKEKI